jgi:glutathione synthase/RimK-type ligase-like ATP-grasp enzyme
MYDSGAGRFRGRRVALATYESAPGLAPDDRPLVPALARVGVRAEPAVWSDSSIPWESYDAVVIRSCWDYHLRVAEFFSWLDRLESAGVGVWNPPALVRWNADKRYLLDLARRGVATIPTMIALRGRARDVEAIVHAEGWHRVVVKPATSASGYETHSLTSPFDDEARDTIARVASLSHVLVQPFVDEIPRDGELSFTFIGGRFSHATLKRARSGEFRVQTEHGGSVESTVADANLVEQASRVLAAIDDVPLYARVDGVVRDGDLLLMELELIEPNVFLGARAGAVDEFAEAIRARLES